MLLMYCQFRLSSILRFLSQACRYTEVVGMCSCECTDFAVMLQVINILHNIIPECLKRQITMHHTLRSEEHTSELQSRFDLVCRLLLEKKKKKKNKISKQKDNYQSLKTLLKKII